MILTQDVRLIGLIQAAMAWLKDLLIRLISKQEMRLNV